jgi:predicted DNA-binding transcriptional regulator
VVKNCPNGTTGTICNYLYSALWLGLTRINAIVRASALISSLRSWVRFLLRTRDTYVKRVSHRFTESRTWVFSGYYGFLSQGMLTGWVGYPLTDPSTAIGLCDKTRVIN